MRLKALITSLVVAALAITGSNPKAEEEQQEATADPSIWLVIGYRVGGLEKIEMKNRNQCEMQGAVLTSSKRLEKTGWTGFECLEGK